VTSVAFAAGLSSDSIEIDGAPAERAAADRVVRHLDRIRALSGRSVPARVVSRNDFPAGTGMASSASAYAALTLAACAASGLALSERDLSRIARAGSGSAARSIPQGFVDLETGDRDERAFADAHLAQSLGCRRSLLVSRSRLSSSTDGHRLGGPLQAARLGNMPLYSLLPPGDQSRFHPSWLRSGTTVCRCTR
jgi:diphosphomevalonate decarboxylase